MAKLMAPNIRIDWIPEGGFADPEKPRIHELNSGTNLSHAVVTGYTLNFLDSDAEDVTTIFDDYDNQIFVKRNYEANLQFFMAPRSAGTRDHKELAYLAAEELFANNTSATGYLVLRAGYSCDYEYEVGQAISLFYVESDVSRIVSEEGAPIILEVPFIPKGFAYSNFRVRALVSYSWVSGVNSSASRKLIDGVEVERNYVPYPRGTSLNFGQYGSGTGGIVTTDNITSSDGPTPELNQYRRANIVTPSDSGSGGWNSSTSGNIPLPAGREGDVYTFSVYIRYTGSAPTATYSLRGHFMSGSNVVNSGQTAYILPSGVWVRLHHTLTSTGNYNNARWWAYFISGDSAPAGSTVDATGAMVTKGSELKEYFDGSMSDVLQTHKTTYSWEGSRRASNSIKRDLKGVIARNLVHVPSFDESISFDSRGNVDIASVTGPNGVNGKLTAHTNTTSTLAGNRGYVVVEGQWAGFALNLAWGEIATRARLQIQFIGPSGEAVTDSQIFIDKAVHPSGGRFTVVDQVPVGATEARIYIWFYLDDRNNAPGVGASLYVDYLSLATGNSHKNVLEQIKTFFDGDSPDEW